MKGKILSVVLILSMMLSLSQGATEVSAYTNSHSDSAYSYYYGKSMADVEARIWLSTGTSGFFVNHFDAKSSSWVFNLMSGVYITNHKNSLTLNKLMVGVDLSVSASGVSGAIKQNDGNIFSVETPTANSYYRGLDVSNVLLKYSVLTVQVCSVTGTSGQTVFIDGQMFINSADTTGYYLGSF